MAAAQRRPGQAAAAGRLPAALLPRVHVQDHHRRRRSTTTSPTLATKVYPTLSALPLPRPTARSAQLRRRSVRRHSAGAVPGLVRHRLRRQIGLDLGGPALTGEAMSFGFNKTPPIDLPGAAQSFFPPGDSFVLDQPGLAFSAIGQQDVPGHPAADGPGRRCHRQRRRHHDAPRARAGEQLPGSGRTHVPADAVDHGHLAADRHPVTQLMVSVVAPAAPAPPPRSRASRSPARPARPRPAQHDPRLVRRLRPGRQPEIAVAVLRGEPARSNEGAPAAPSPRPIARAVTPGTALHRGPYGFAAGMAS